MRTQINFKLLKSLHQNITLCPFLILIMQTVELINQQQQFAQERIFIKIAHALLNLE